MAERFYFLQIMHSQPRFSFTSCTARPAAFRAASTSSLRLSMMADNGVFIASGIIDSRKDEVIAALEAAGLAVLEVKEKRGWECIVCKKA